MGIGSTCYPIFFPMSCSLFSFHLFPSFFKMIYIIFSSSLLLLTLFFQPPSPSLYHKSTQQQQLVRVAPDEEAVTIRSTNSYSGGRFEFKVKSAAVMPGIITAVYLASGEGRKGDNSLGNQDELDWEWKGNDPTNVQTSKSSLFCPIPGMKGLFNCSL